MVNLRTFAGTPGKEVFYSVGIARLANDKPGAAMTISIKIMKAC